MPTFTAFSGFVRIARGSLEAVAVGAKRALDADANARVLIFDDASGGQVDFDLRGGEAEVIARLAEHPVYGADAGARRGRPRLGVASREVSLLPRHWNWLRSQPRSASATLRRLVDAEMKLTAASDRQRAAAEAAHRFLWALAGDLPAFEEVTRALDGGRLDDIGSLAAEWPADVREHLLRLAKGEGLAEGE